MRTLGIALHSGDPKTVAEEAAFAYKDIETVMAAAATMVRPTKRLTPLGVVKGYSVGRYRRVHPLWTRRGGGYDAGCDGRGVSTCRV